MRHWSQIATRNWRVRPLRTAAAIAAIAIGTAAVVWVTCTFESVSASILSWANQYAGKASVTIESPLGKYGTISQSLLSRIGRGKNIKDAVPLLMRRMRGALYSDRTTQGMTINGMRWNELMPELDVYGVEPLLEPKVRDWKILPGNGRFLTPEDTDAAVLERATAEEWDVGLGDHVFLWGGAQSDPFVFKIVGLVERRRIARFQKGLVLIPIRQLQAVDVQQGRLTSIDLVLDDNSSEAINATRGLMMRTIRNSRFSSNANVNSTLARVQQIENAQSQQELVLVLLSCVAMLTALFIILSTLSMGMIERVIQLGLLRCIGVTSWQLASMILVEVTPLGFLGVAIGVPAGLLLAGLTVWLAPEYVGEFAISTTGVSLAILAGLITTFAAAVLPMISALGVSPLEAAHPRAARQRRWPIFVTALLGLGLGAAQLVVLEKYAVRSPEFVHWAATAVVLLYLAYACLAPLIVWLLGSASVALVAGMLGIKRRLLQDQVGFAVWRSTGIVSGLMVGLSLIVGLVAFSTSVRSGWQFPKQFPAAYIWSFSQIRGHQNDVDEIMQDVPNIDSYTAINAVNVIVEERPLFMERVFSSVTWFMGCEPDEFFDLVRVEFLEGSKEEAIKLLKSGGYIVVTEDFSRSRNKHLGDEVKIYYANSVRLFKVAAVCSSPALDIAAGYFQVNSAMRVVASGSVLGTNADMERFFRIQGRRLILINFGLQEEPPPDDWPPPRNSPEGRYLPERFYSGAMTRERTWLRYREDQVLREAVTALGVPQAFWGTAADLKDSIDAEFNKFTRLLSAVPAVALLVAALGVANLMSASVAARAKQLAILRAVGATRGILLRLVFGEALVLGVVGSGLGVALGLHLAWITSTLTARMWGFELEIIWPWEFLVASIATTILLCIIAAIIPARRAARTDVVEALHVT